jgi:Protein of unknown function (DUF3489)
MTTFSIDAQNNITAFTSTEQNEGSGGETFSNEQELAALAEKWPAARLVEIWNSLPGVQPLQRFTSRKAALTRIWNSIQRLESGAGAHKRRVPAKKRSPGKKAPRGVRKRVGGPTKTARVIALLQRPQGATLQVIMRATGWQTHSVRGFISGQLKKKLGLKVRSSIRDGERVYSIKLRS